MTYHTPVLVGEVAALLQPRAGGQYLDATVGGGGHAAAVLSRCGPAGRLIGLDRDDEALAASRERLQEFGDRVQLVRANFAELGEVLMNLGVTAVDGVLFDLGVSAHQFEEPTRGFSLQREGPLDMRMDRRLGVTARDVLRTASLEELARIFQEYGEERRSRAVAREIVRRRERGEELATTTALAELVARVSGGPSSRGRRGTIHPATRVFQALRIAVNDELGSLERALPAALTILRAGGRLAVISFHSLEDRLVKRFFQDASTGCICPRDFPVCRCQRRQVARLVTRRVVTAAAAEQAVNPRARSAKLRVAEKI